MDFDLRSLPLWPGLPRLPLPRRTSVTARRREQVVLLLPGLSGSPSCHLLPTPAVPHGMSVPQM